MNMKNNVQHNTILYDLVNDMAETTDVSSKHPEIREQMLAEFKEWYSSVKDSAKYESACYKVPKEKKDAGH